MNSRQKGHYLNPKTTVPLANQQTEISELIRNTQLHALDTQNKRNICLPEIPKAHSIINSFQGTRNANTKPKDF